MIFTTLFNIGDWVSMTHTVKTQGYIDCPHCEGRGEIRVETVLGEPFDASCPKCCGDGEISVEKEVTITKIYAVNTIKIKSGVGKIQVFYDIMNGGSSVYDVEESKLERIEQ